jgi:hypothetical protein
MNHVSQTRSLWPQRNNPFGSEREAETCEQARRNPKLTPGRPPGGATGIVAAKVPTGIARFAQSQHQIACRANILAQSLSFLSPIKITNEPKPAYHGSGGEAPMTVSEGVRSSLGWGWSNR